MSYEKFCLENPYTAIQVITKSQIKYIGILTDTNEPNGTITLSHVTVNGTEHRLPPSSAIKKQNVLLQTLCLSLCHIDSISIIQSPEESAATITEIRRSPK